MLPKGEKDIRKMLESNDFEAVVIATPDHWHAKAAIMAMQAGKHVYLESDKLCVRSLPVVLKTIPTSDRINLCRIIYAQSPAEYINKVGSIVERFTCSPIW